MIHRDTIILIAVLVLLLVFLIYQKQKNKDKEGFLGIGESSQSVTVSSVMNVINSNITSTIISMKNTSSTSCDINQNISVTCKRCKYRNCNMSSINKATSNCNSSSIFTNNNTANMLTSINQAIDNSTNTNQKSVQDFLSTSVSDQNTNISMATHIKNIVAKNFTSDMLNICQTKSKINQNNVLEMEDMDVDCGGGNIDWGNDAQLMVMSSCISKQLTSIISNDDLVQKAINSTTAGQSSEQKGLGDLITGFLDSLSGPMKYALITVAIVIVVAIIGVVIFLTSSGGQEMTKTLSAAAADKIKKS